jgi:hypothetical protein
MPCDRCIYGHEGCTEHPRAGTLPGGKFEVQVQGRRAPSPATKEVEAALLEGRKELEIARKRGELAKLQADMAAAQSYMVKARQLATEAQSAAVERALRVIAAPADATVDQLKARIAELERGVTVIAPRARQGGCCCCGHDCCGPNPGPDGSAGGASAPPAPHGFVAPAPAVPPVPPTDWAPSAGGAFPLSLTPAPQAAQDCDAFQEEAESAECDALEECEEELDAEKLDSDEDLDEWELRGDPLTLNLGRALRLRGDGSRAAFVDQVGRSLQLSDRGARGLLGVDLRVHRSDGAAAAAELHELVEEMREEIEDLRSTLRELREQVRSAHDERLR